MNDRSEPESPADSTACPAGEQRPASLQMSNVSVRSSVVDVHFDQCLPSIYSVLRAGAEGGMVVEVLAQLDPHRVRCIALTPTQGLARGMPVDDTGGPLLAPVGKTIISRMFADRLGSPPQLRLAVTIRSAPRRTYQASIVLQRFLAKITLPRERLFRRSFLLCLSRDLRTFPTFFVPP